MDVLGTVQGDQVANACMDILDGLVGMVVANDLIEGDVFVDQIQDIPYRDARACDAWFAEVNSQINEVPVYLMPPSFFPVAGWRFGDQTARNAPW